MKEMHYTYSMIAALLRIFRCVSVNIEGSLIVLKRRAASKCFSSLTRSSTILSSSGPDNVGCDVVFCFIMWIVDNIKEFYAHGSSHSIVLSSSAIPSAAIAVSEFHFNSHIILNSTKTVNTEDGINNSEVLYL